MSVLHTLQAYLFGPCEFRKNRKTNVVCREPGEQRLRQKRISMDNFFYKRTVLLS